LNLISFILVKASIDDGILDIVSRQLQQHGTRQLLFWACQKGNLQMKHRRPFEPQFFLARMLRFVSLHSINFSSILVFMSQDLKFEMDLAGEMGQKSIYCIHVLWTDNIMSCVSPASPAIPFKLWWFLSSSVHLGLEKFWLVYRLSILIKKYRSFSSSVSRLSTCETKWAFSCADCMPSSKS